MTRRAHLAAGLVALVAATGSQAQPAAPNFAVEWDLPTQRADGQPLAQDEIARTVIVYGRCASDGQVAEPVSVAEIATPATEAALWFDPGEVCARAYVVDVDGEIGEPTLVARGYAGQRARPSPPANLTILAIEPSTGAVVAPRAAGSASNLVYRRHTSGSGEWIGDVGAGLACDCTDTFEAAWGAGAGTYCGVGGHPNLRASTYVALGAPFPTNAWTRCDPQP